MSGSVGMVSLKPKTIVYPNQCYQASVLKWTKYIAYSFVLQMSCYCKCSVTLPHGGVGWFALCGCGISWSYSPTFWLWSWYYLRNRSAPAVNCWVIIHCLEVSCKEDQITSAQREWFIAVQLTDKQWIITQQFTHWSWSISILTHSRRRKHIRSLQLLPTFRHCTEEIPPILRLRHIRLHVIVTSFKRKNDVTPSNAMSDVIF